MQIQTLQARDLDPSEDAEILYKDINRSNGYLVETSKEEQQLEPRQTDHNMMKPETQQQMRHFQRQHQIHRLQLGYQSASAPAYDPEEEKQQDIQGLTMPSEREEPLRQLQRQQQTPPSQQQQQVHRHHSQARELPGPADLQHQEKMRQLQRQLQVHRHQRTQQVARPSSHSSKRGKEIAPTSPTDMDVDGELNDEEGDEYRDAVRRIWGQRTSDRCG